MKISENLNCLKINTYFHKYERKDASCNSKTVIFFNGIIIFVDIFKKNCLIQFLMKVNIRS